MRHSVSGRKLSRTTSHRLAMFRNLVTSLLQNERVYTTDAKAKEIRRWADRMITLGKRGDLHARRQALQVVRDKTIVAKLFTDLAQRYQARSGGYTRTVKVGFRPGDGAPISIIELMAGETEKKKKKRKGKKEGAAPARKKKAAPAKPAKAKKEGVPKKEKKAAPATAEKPAPEEPKESE
ncbi:MAG TPA: 50S ribosomal protein L17 [Syntrophobacteria bacterium]|nr:50S ribosomal protein L17 [Syntrophobacteria bacterium]